MLEDELSIENILNYADACIGMALDMPAKKVDTIIIPSRGAVPIFLGMIEALNYFSEEDKEYKKFLDNMRIGKLVRKYLPASIGNSIENYLLDSTHENVEVLFLPFTADLNMERYSKSANSNFYANNMRRFWPKVISALSKGKRERARDPYLHFVDFIHREIEDRPDLGEELWASKWIEKKNFAIIDTVISGRAYSTIFEGFKDLKVGTPGSFLIIDDNGKRLKDKYKSTLHLRAAKECQKSLELRDEKINAYYVNRIFSEDRGAAFEGLVGVVYPSLMVQAENDDEIQKKLGHLSCSSWYSIPEGYPHKKAFECFTSMLKEAVMSKCKNTGVEKIEENRQRFLKVINENSLLNQDNAHSIKINYKGLKPVDVYETGSHVLHVCFSDEDSRKILNKFKAYLNSKL